MIDYDSFLGITAAIRTLAGLNELTEERHKAGYEREERMREWHICDGRIWLDTCGNAMIVHKPPAELAGVPCISREDAVKAKLSFTGSHSNDLPRAAARCPRCGAAWTIENWYDCKAVQQPMDLVDISQHAGKTLEQASKLLAAELPHGVRFCGNEVENDADIDMSPHPRIKDYPANDRGRSSVERETYVVRPGDKAFVYAWEFFHPACLQEIRHRDERRFFLEIFTEAGFKKFNLKPVKNGYWGESYDSYSSDPAPPWFEVETELGQIIIGWRKRVISIEWPRELGFPEVLKTEKVTSSAQYPGCEGEGETLLIHAWGKEKAIEYLRAIRELRP